jgi:hypothetical protein
MAFIDPEKVKEINAKVYERAHVDREHLLEFLEALTTSDAKDITVEVKKWLTDLHNDATYDKVRFADGDIDAVIGDLDSYGRVQPGTILRFKQNSNKTLPIS